jgi:hypothetical protein
MKKLFSLAVVCTFWLAFTGSAGADIIYHVNLPVDGGSVTGTITTDGAIGTLFNGDITAFNLTLFDGTATATLMDGVNGGSIFIGAGSLAATPTDLTFNFNLSVTFVNFFTSPGCQPIWTLRTNGGSACNAVSGTVMSVQATSTTGPATMSEIGAGNVVIGTTTVIPEPGSVGLMVTGLASLIGLRKRRF